MTKKTKIIIYCLLVALVLIFILFGGIYFNYESKIDSLEKEIKEYQDEINILETRIENLQGLEYPSNPSDDVENLSCTEGEVDFYEDDYIRLFVTCTEEKYSLINIAGEDFTINDALEKDLISLKKVLETLQGNFNHEIKFQLRLNFGDNESKINFHDGTVHYDGITSVDILIGNQTYDIETAFNINAISVGSLIDYLNYNNTFAQTLTEENGDCIYFNQFDGHGVIDYRNKDDYQFYFSDNDSNINIDICN